MSETRQVEQPGKQPTTPQRITVAVAIATLTAAISWYRMASAGPAESDFGQVWFAAHALLHGGDPYQLIGPNLRFNTDFPLLYPLTAAVSTLPLAVFSKLAGTIAFAWISTALLAFAITRKGWQLLPLFLSAPFLIAALRVQWSILLCAGLAMPSLALFFTAKPSIGLALLASNPSKRAIVAATMGGVLFGLIGLLVAPRWPIEWFHTLGATGHMVVPILHPSGLVTALALLRWRRPEARLILALACVPQTLSWYEALPLLLVATTFRESLLLSLASSITLVYEIVTRRGDGVLLLYPSSVTALVLFAYVPPLILVLRRPKEGEAPAFFHPRIRQHERTKT
jgi:hypothetical protein